MLYLLQILSYFQSLRTCMGCLLGQRSCHLVFMAASRSLRLDDHARIIHFAVLTSSISCDLNLPVSLVHFGISLNDLVYGVFSTGSKHIFEFSPVYVAGDSKFNTDSRDSILRHVSQDYGTNSTLRLLDSIGAAHRVTGCLHEQGARISYCLLYADKT